MIQGKKVRLQLVREKDLDKLYAFHSDISNRGQLFPLQIIPEPLFKTKFKETGFWNDEFSQMLILNKKEEIVGSIWSMKTVPYFNALEIGYIIYDQKNYNQGYMTEALRLFANYVFKIKTINRLEIRIVPSHIASEKVALKCGFTFEGVVREAFFHHGKNENLKQYAYLRSDYEKKLSKSVDS